METGTCAIINASTRKMNALKNEAMFGRSRKILTDKEGREREREAQERKGEGGRGKGGTCTVHVTFTVSTLRPIMEPSATITKER